MKTLRLTFFALLFFTPLAAWGQQTINGSIIRSGTTPLTALASSGATANQILQWSGSAWSPATLAAGNGLTLTFAGGTFTLSLTTPVSVANGGTGQSSFTDGQLLIGDSSTNGLDKATLTAGSGITVTNGHGSITIASTGGGGSTTVTSGVGAGAPYSLTQSYADTGVTLTLSNSNTVRLEGLAEWNDLGANASDDLRFLLYDATQGYYVPWSETRILSPSGFEGGTTGNQRGQVMMSAIFTPGGSADVIHIYATNASGSRGTVTPWRSSITAEQVSGSSSQTQDSNSLPFTTGLVSHYDASTLGLANGANVTTWSDSGSAGLTLSAGTTPATYAAKGWNGLGVVSWSSSGSAMASSGVSTTSTSFDIFVVCNIPAVTSKTIFLNANNSGFTGYGIESGTSADEFTCNIGATNNIITSASLAPLNGWYLVELQRTSGGTTTLYVDGLSQGTSTNTPTTPTGNLQVGANNSAMQIGEILLYSSALNSTNQANVQNYLMSKWEL
jgi:hypothetical protein